MVEDTSDAWALSLQEDIKAIRRMRGLKALVSIIEMSLLLFLIKNQLPTLLIPMVILLLPFILWKEKDIGIFDSIAFRLFLTSKNIRKFDGTEKHLQEETINILSTLDGVIYRYLDRTNPGRLDFKTQEKNK